MNAQQERPAGGVSARLALALILAAWTLGALPGLVQAPLHRASQARAWCVARTMADGGSWLVPEYHGEPRLKKPPLQSWIQAAAMTIRQSTSLRVAGFMSWLVGLLWVATPYLLGGVLRRPTAGLLGSMALASSRAAEWWGTSPEHDIPFGAFVGLAWVFLAKALSNDGRARDSWLAGLATGAALLVKGPFALAFVTAVAVVESIRRRNDPTRGRISWTGLVVGTVALPLAWLALLAMELGSVRGVFDEMLSQATGAEGAHTRPGILGWLFYFGVVPSFSLPWAIPAIPAFLWAWKRRRTDPSLAPFPAFARTALLVGLAVITIVPAKQDHYMLPLLPAAFLILGSAFDDVLRHGSPSVVRRVPLVALVSGVVLAASRVYGARIVGFVGPVPQFGVVLALAAVALPRPREGWMLWRPLIGLLLAATFAGWAANADAVRYRRTDDYRETAAAVTLPGDEDLDVVGYAAGDREAFDTLVAWLENPKTRYARVRTVEELSKRLDAGGRFRLLVPGNEEAAIAPVRDRLAPRGVFVPAKPKDRKDTVLLFVPRGR